MAPEKSIDGDDVEITSAADLVKMREMIRKTYGHVPEMQENLISLMGAAQRAKRENPEADLMDIVVKAIEFLPQQMVDADEHHDCLDALQNSSSLGEAKKVMSDYARAKGQHRAISKNRVQTIRNVHEAIGRNDPCPCGCGKKAKKCPNKKN